MEVFSFDLDGTLIKTKSGRKFAKSKDDWEWYHPFVPDRIEEVKKKYKIIVFTNQKKAKDFKREQVENVCEELGIEFKIAIDSDHLRKPMTGMWKEFMIEHPTIKSGYYCGDMETDKCFAHNCGLVYIHPEQMFRTENISFLKTIRPIQYPSQFEGMKASQKEIDELKERLDRLIQPCLVLTVGSPSCGKSSLAINYFPTYIRVNQDKLKTLSKCLRKTQLSLEEGRNVIVDNTNPAEDTRAKYIELSRSLGISTTIIYFDLGDVLPSHINYMRSEIDEIKLIPDIAYRLYRKKLEIPDGENVIVLKKLYWESYPREFDYRFV